VILIAIGANLATPDGTPPLETCRQAVRAIAALPRLSLHSVSRWYKTAPIPPGPQPNYVNGVARLDGTAEPADLLAALHRVEARAGRLRAGRNAARSLDLDIIDMDGQVRDAPDPVLPHPRAHLRAFVLVPLLDVAPDWVHPRLHQSAQELLHALPPQEIRPLVQ
jgi:2-amino-4-hydroxy-6-hydroxymethyldihydropteridine diphosphokinase